MRRPTESFFVLVLLLASLSCAERPHETAADAFVDWAAANSISLRALDSGSKPTELDALLATLSSARVVGLGDDGCTGEQSLRLRLRLARFLIETKGFSALATEAPFAEALRVDGYVRGSPGDARELLAGMGPGEWTAEPLVEFMEWMRRRNQDELPQAGFYGLESQSLTGSLAGALRFLEAVEPKAAADFRRELADTELGEEGLQGLSEASQRSIADTVRALLELLTRQKEEYAAARSVEEWNLAFRHAVVAQQGLPGVWFDEPSSRDASMAENLLWLLDREGPQGRIVLWAHNERLARSAPGDSMGEYLAAALGDELYVAALTCAPGRGSAEPPSADSVELALRRVGEASFWLDLRRAPTSGLVARWLEREHRMRPGEDGSSSLPKEETDEAPGLGAQFDALYFVEDAG